MYYSIRVYNNKFCWHTWNKSCEWLYLSIGLHVFFSSNMKYTKFTGTAAGLSDQYVFKIISLIIANYYILPGRVFNNSKHILTKNSSSIASTSLKNFASSIKDMGWEVKSCNHGNKKHTYNFITT